MKKDLFLFWFLVSEGLMDGPLAHARGQNIMVMGISGRRAFSSRSGWETEKSATGKGHGKNRVPQRYVPSDQLSPSKQLPSNNHENLNLSVDKALH